MIPAPRIVIAIEPRMYAEALAFSVLRHRPHAQVSILEPSADLEAEAHSMRPHLVVANVVGPGVREASSSWVEVERPGSGEGPKRLGADMGADGYQASVGDVPHRTCACDARAGVEGRLAVLIHRSAYNMFSP